MKLFLYFIRKSVAAKLSARLLLKTNSSQYSFEGVLTIYFQAVSHLLETYTTDDIITDTNSNNGHFVKQLNMSPVDFVNLFWLEKLSCLHV